MEKLPTNNPIEGQRKEKWQELTPHEVEMVFANELHTGERIRRHVDRTLEEVKPEWYKDRIEIMKNDAEQTLTACANMLEELPPEEKAAYEYVLREQSKDLYFAYYMALRNRLGDEEKLKE